MFKKAQKMGAGGVVIIILIIAVVAQFTGIYDFGTLVPKKKSGLDSITDVTPQLNFDCVDVHNPQTSVTCSVTYKVENGGFKSDGDGADISVAQGKKVEYMVNASSYYSVHGELTMPRENEVDVPIKMLNHDTAPTIQMFNQLGTSAGLLNGEAQPERLLANNQPKTEVNVLTSYKDGIMGATFVVDFGGTGIDDITSSIGADIVEPSYLSHNNSNRSNNGTAGNSGNDVVRDTFRSFLIGNMNADPSKGTSENVKFTINVDVGGSDYIGQGNQDSWSVGLIDKDWYSDTNGGFSFGYEEPVDNTDQGQSSDIPKIGETWFFVNASA